MTIHRKQVSRIAGCFLEINTLYYRQWGVSPHLFTAIVIPVKSNRNKHVRAQQ